MNIADIFAEARSLVDATSASYADAVLLRRLNASNEDMVSEIINADGTWQFDDRNFTTNPIGVGTLIAGQSSYSFANDFLDIENIKIQDINGNWRIIDPIDQSQTDVALEQYLKVDGMPACYDKIGNTIKLYPAPSASVVTLVGGLKVQFKRTADLFTTDDLAAGTKQPGFALNHIILAYKIALPYASSYKKDRVAYLMAEIKRLRDEIIRHYSTRERDKRKVMSNKTISFR